MTDRRRAAGDTHPGLQRANNEDRFFFDDRRGVYCVIDGVGGHNAGERAAEIASDTIRAALAAPGALAGVRLRDAFARANDAIVEAARREAALNGMACVATLAIVEAGRCRFAHVGDTRLYKIHAGAIAKITRDHSPVGELEDAGTLTEMEAMRHPRRNEIYRDLGTRRLERADEIEIGDIAFEADAALVLCSDGLSDQVSAGSVRRIVESFAGSPALAVQELINAANDAGGKDNVTAIVVEGEAFAAATSVRPPGSRPPAGRSAASAAAHVASTDRDRATRPVPPDVSPAPIGQGRARGGWGRAVMWLTGGLVAGTALGVAAERFDLIETARARLGFATERPPRVWRVGLQPSSDFATIGEALQAASPGDTVSVGPGEYREAVVFKSGVSIDAARDSVLRPPLGASAGFTAVTIRDAGSGRLRGLSIVGTPDQPVGTGVAVERSSVAIEEIEVSGAVTAGVAFGPGGQPVLRGSHVHGNPGPGITVAALAEPRLERNVILQNGSAGGPAPAVLVAAGARPILTGNGLAGRGAPAVQGWPAAGLAELVRQNVLSPDPIARPAEERRRPPPRPR